MQLWVVGSLNTDLIVGCPRFAGPGETILGRSYVERPGGKGGNQAVALARLGCRPRLVAAVGDDPRGTTYLGLLAEEGVDTSLVFRRPGIPTGVALIEVAGGENRIVVVPGANATLGANDVLGALAEVARGDLVLFQLEIPLETVVKAVAWVQERGAQVLVDPAPAVPLPKGLWTADYLTPNLTEARICVDLSPDLGPGEDLLDAARTLVDRGCRRVVQKAGARGAFLVTRDGTVERPAFPAVVVDTVGAGDAFNAGFAAGLARGLGATDALAWGNAAGALSTRAAGAQGGLPTLAEVRALVG